MSKRDQRHTNDVTNVPLESELLKNESDDEEVAPHSKRFKIERAITTSSYAEPIKELKRNRSEFLLQATPSSPFERWIAKLKWDSTRGMYWDAKQRKHFDPDSNLSYNFDVTPYKAYHFSPKVRSFFLVNEGEFRLDDATFAETSEMNEQFLVDPQAKILQRGDMEFDSTSGFYFCHSNGLYYDTQEDLLFFLESFPRVAFHWHPTRNTLMQVIDYRDVLHEAELKILQQQEQRELKEQIETDTNTNTNTNTKTTTDDPEEGEIKDLPKFPPYITLQIRWLDNAQTPTRSIVLGDKNDGVFERTLKLGRDKKNDVVFDETAVSRFHAEIQWQTVFFENHFWLMDVGSVHGTKLNGKLLSEKRTASLAKDIELEPGDVVVLGEAIEIKVDRTTEEELKAAREQWKPPKKGEVPAAPPEVKADRNVFNLTSAERQHRQDLKTKYVDRSALRRETIGSEGPSIVQRPIEPERITAETPIPQNNVGFNLLTKLGWSGTGLGKNEQGIVNPVQNKSTKGTKGLGFAS